MSPTLIQKVDFLQRKKCQATVYTTEVTTEKVVFEKVIFRKVIKPKKSEILSMDELLRSSDSYGDMWDTFKDYQDFNQDLESVSTGGSKF